MEKWRKRLVTKRLTEIQNQEKGVKPFMKSAPTGIANAAEATRAYPTIMSVVV